MSQIKILILALAILFAPGLCSSGCAPSTEPVDDLEPNIPPAMMGTQQSRVWVDESGDMHDKALGDIRVDWAFGGDCAKALFPIEELFPACDKFGNVYYYTRQALSETFAYGRISTPQNPECKGETTNKLVSLKVMNNIDKLTARGLGLHPCTGPGIYLMSMLYDRQWYYAKPVEITPAGMSDLPGAGPG